MKCHACEEWEGVPVYEMGLSGRVRPHCPKCGAALSDAVELSPTMDSTSESILTHKPAPMPVIKLKPDGGIEVPLPIATAVDVVGIARARLTVVESQLADMRALEREAERLRRMLAAADAEPN